MNRGPTTSIRQQRPGFTLLELLIASLLLVTLMSGVWGLTNLYTGLLSSGREQVAEQRLARSLGVLLTEDLQSVVVPTTQAIRRPARQHGFPSNTTESTQPRFDVLRETRMPTAVGGRMQSNQSPNQLDTDNSGGIWNAADSGEDQYDQHLPVFFLRGTHQSLTLSVSQAVAEWDLTWPGQDPELNTRRDTDHSTFIAPPLKQIHYTFQAPYVRIPNDRRPPAGLLRRERPWVRTEGQQSLGTPSTDQIDLANTHHTWPSPEREHVTLATVRDTSGGPAKQPASGFLVPEVVGCRFRYFDGAAWLNSWDTHRRQCLPLAVEVEFWLLTPAELTVAFPTGTQRTEDNPPSTQLSPSAPVSPSAADENPSQPILARRYRHTLLLRPSVFHGATGDQERDSLPGAMPQPINSITKRGS